ncbi:hypothetical protein LOAG_15648, partial [Loa loa]
KKVKGTLYYYYYYYYNTLKWEGNESDENGTFSRDGENWIEEEGETTTIEERSLCGTIIYWTDRRTDGRTEGKKDQGTDELNGSSNTTQCFNLTPLLLFTVTSTVATFTSIILLN